MKTTTEFLKIVKHLNPAPTLNAIVKDLEMATGYASMTVKMPEQQARVDLFDAAGNFIVQVLVGEQDREWDIEDIKMH